MCVLLAALTGGPPTDLLISLSTCNLSSYLQISLLTCFWHRLADELGLCITCLLFSLPTYPPTCILARLFAISCT